MYVQHVFGLVSHPKEEWQDIVEERHSIFQCYVRYLIWLAAIPALSLLYGTTQVGWSLSGGDVVRLTVESAVPIAISFYVALLVAVAVMAYAMYWMEKTYGVDASLDRCFVVITYTATPLFIAGFAGLYPVMWFDALVGLVAVSYAIYLLLKGTPVMGHISEERGFLFSMSIATVGLCVLVGLLAFSVILWMSAMPPVFIR